MRKSYLFSLLLTILLALPPMLVQAQGVTGFLKVSQPRQGEVVLSYQPSRLGFMDAIEIVVPQGINIKGTDTYVNIIGRGEVPLDSLSSQSVGRHGNKSAIKSVGTYSIGKSAKGKLLTLRNVDLRPANTPAITLRFTYVSLRKGNTSSFKARYLLSDKYKIDNEAWRGEAYAVGNGEWSAQSEAKFVYGKLDPAVTHKEINASELGIKPGNDCTARLNEAIENLSRNGGGTIVFGDGTYNVRTVKLKSHVWLRLSKGTSILMCGKGDAPEKTWYKDHSVNAGSGSLDATPYDDTDNYLIKQDMGHSFFHNAMFVAERQEDIRIVGNGRISGNNWLKTGNGERNDKMFSLKQCRNIEIGGISNGLDLWYDQQADEPYYLNANGQREGDTSGMMHIDNGGHFVLLATGTDSISFHDVYCGKASTNNARDILDFMECRYVSVSNLYSKVNGDDIMKIGSDCSLGFTRKAWHYMVRNVIGDTNCNVFQIGSETADDITDVWVDNLYVLGTNKAGFSISSNDGGIVSRIWFGSGKTGTLRRSQFMRTRTPFFLSIANRARVIGSDAKPFTYNENGIERRELLVTNIPIGRVENISIRGVDVKEVYAGSCYRTTRWKPYSGQAESTPIIAGYKLPDDKDVKGGLGFTLPDGDMKRDIENVTIEDVNVILKGGHKQEDANAIPPEMGFGKFNIRDFLVQPSWAVWARHAKGVRISNSRFSTEKSDGRPAFRFDDATDCVTTNVTTRNGE